ncbi:2-dehydropantoate 2-reductase [Teratosphaeria destructans]|uniref:2-dehydropantoate 2-reductase n=1 Tax=Teratosphaeria destructans TaxID=418781 RepID=A0A9W7W0J0_9PEZI|nr:2-dehydropantoate 2-reductase [Teratosphaeria destructans]
MPTSILLVGAGAIGSFFASRLAQGTSTVVSAICRSNYQAVNANGFKVISSKFGEYVFTPDKTFNSPAEARQSGMKWDLLLVATKALGSEDSKLLDGLVSDDTTIALIQNGIGVEEPFIVRFPHTPIVTATTVASVAQLKPGQIKHYRLTRTSVGPYAPHDQSTNSKAMQSARHFVSLLQAGGLTDAELHDHSTMQFVRWHKLATNAGMNPSSVLAGGLENHEMCNDPDFAAHLIGVMHEVLHAAEKVLGRSLPRGLPTPQQVVRSTGRLGQGSSPSMRRDWEDGRPVELEAILGNPVRMARAVGVEMPRVQTLYALLKKAQEKRDQRVGPKL